MEEMQMTDEDIKKIISEEEYEFYGIRKDSAEYKLGETVRNSRQFFSGSAVGG